jgi:hypothetical protein
MIIVLLTTGLPKLVARPAIQTDCDQIAKWGADSRALRRGRPAAMPCEITVFA